MTEVVVIGLPLLLLMLVPAVATGQGEWRAGDLMRESTDAKPERDGSIGFILYLVAENNDASTKREIRAGKRGFKCQAASRNRIFPGWKYPLQNVPLL